MEEEVIEEVNEDDNQPATKGFVRATITTAVDGLRSEMKGMKTELRSEMSAMKEEIISEFKVVAENIHKDVAGASQDAVNLLTNQVPDHEDRLVDLEKHAGLPAGPRHEHVR